MKMRLVMFFIICTFSFSMELENHKGFPIYPPEKHKGKMFSDHFILSLNEKDGIMEKFSKVNIESVSDTIYCRNLIAESFKKITSEIEIAREYIKTNSEKEGFKKRDVFNSDFICHPCYTEVYAKITSDKAIKVTVVYNLSRISFGRGPLNYSENFGDIEYKFEVTSEPNLINGFPYSTKFDILQYKFFNTEEGNVLMKYLGDENDGGWDELFPEYYDWKTFAFIKRIFRI